MQEFRNDPKSLFKVLNEITGKQKESVVPMNEDNQETAEKMSNFYIEKVIKIREEISKQQNSKSSKVVELQNRASENGSPIFEKFEQMNIYELKM